MKQLLQTVTIVVVAIAATLLAISIGTAVTLSITPWGRVVSGRTTLPVRPWESVSKEYYVLLFFVFLPTVLATGFLVAKFAKRVPLIAAALAILPASLIASGFRLGAMWATITLALCGAGAGFVSERIQFHRNNTA